MIITGGENVSPVEVESRLSGHEAVSEVAAVGLPDPRRGQLGAAFIRRRAPAPVASWWPASTHRNIQGNLRPDHRRRPT